MNLQERGLPRFHLTKEDFLTAPQALVVYGDGINCDLETVHILQTVGFEVVSVHVTDLLRAPERLKHSKLFCVPGGFSFGDEIASGKVLALKLGSHLQDAIQHFIAEKRLVLGICNGFQVLTQLGLLPFPEAGAPRVVSLTRNKEKKFRNKWVSLDVSKSKAASIFFKGLNRIDLPMRHGEGNLKLEPLSVADSAAHEIESTIRKLASLRYVEDVNGSFDRIAALSSEDGTVMGLMPHPEAFVRFTQHPCWTEWRAQDHASKKSHGHEQLPASAAIEPDSAAALPSSGQTGPPDRSWLHRTKPIKPDGLVIFENAFAYCQSL